MSPSPTPPTSDRPRCQRCGTRIDRAPCTLCAPGAAPERPLGAGLGIGDLGRGLVFMLARPGLWPYVALPFLLNAGIWVALYYVFIGQLVPEVVPDPTSEYFHVIEIAATIIFALLAVALFGFFGSVVNAPFYDFLSEATEKRYLGGVAGGTHARGLLARWITPVVSAAKATLWILLWYLLWLPLHLIPVIGSLLYFLAIGRLRTFEILVFPLSRKSYSLREMLTFMRRIWWRSFGLGTLLNFLVLLPMLVIPFGGMLFFLFYPVLVLTGMIGWLATPIAVVGGTLLYLDADK